KLLRALRFFHPRPGRVLHLPGDGGRPYDGFSPDPAHPRARLRALERVDRGTPVVVVAEATALLQRVPDAVARQRLRLVLRPDEVLDRDVLVRWLSNVGYFAAERAHEEGFFSVRGDVVDVWPARREQPLRIDFFDDEIESISVLDPATWRSVGTKNQVVLLAAREEILDAEALERAATELARYSAEQGRDSGLRRRVLEDLRAGVRFAGLEAWLPALVPVESAMQALAGLRTLVVHPDDVAATMRERERTIHERFDLMDDGERPLVPPQSRYSSAEVVLEALAGAHRVHDVPRSTTSNLGAASTDGFGVRGTELGPAVKRLDDMADQGASVVLVCGSVQRAENLREMMEPHGVFPLPASDPLNPPAGSVSQMVGDLPRGFLAPDAGVVFLPDTALFGSRSRRGLADRIHTFFDAALTHVAQIKEGDFVVHKRHGVGVYKGLQRMDVGGSEQDLARVMFRGGDLMYLPVSRLGQLSRYVPANDGKDIKLDKLGGATWEARKGKVRDSLLAMADELLRISAKRELANRAPYSKPADLYHAFVARFPHDETPDQHTAIEAIQEDLSGDVPMDRLLCGDVGFGKTEVAMRAAARVVEGGRQVAVLCPTTVLAYQHVQTFRERFGDLPVKVGLLCRFNSAAEDREVREGLREGEYDVVVGTTSLLARGIRYKRLGLMVIDEEHRFGVRQKERLKKMRAEVDVLSMSATPIPRTLQMGLSGLREMSIMATPPQDRLAVRTSVAQLKRVRIRDALLHELDRSGQAFFVHNRVESIERIADRLRTWVPEARVEVAHGQMDSTKLEEVLVRFTKHEFDVLVCTAIMEAGIDLPNVNTMIVNRSDLCGLAQLYQLRGRVGRGSVRAQCLLLLPEGATQEARRRVQVLVEHSGLGAGFQVAAADLEMRGAGNLIGHAQSGNIDAVGYEVWLELLEEAVHKARGEMDAGRVETEVEVPVDAFIPEQMVKDVHERLNWYRRLSSATTVAQVDQVLEDLELERGTLPVEVDNLAGLMIAQIHGRQMGLTRIAWLKVRVMFEFHGGTKVRRSVLDGLQTKMPKRMKVVEAAGEPLRLDVRFTPSEAERPYRFIRWVLSQLMR
ncbi:MAG: transcription-repair coupling factor, partial [Myxococcota bacterium]